MGWRGRGDAAQAPAETDLYLPLPQVWALRLLRGRRCHHRLGFPVRRGEWRSPSPAAACAALSPAEPRAAGVPPTPASPILAAAWGPACSPPAPAAGSIFFQARLRQLHWVSGLPVLRGAGSLPSPGCPQEPSSHLTSACRPCASETPSGDMQLVFFFFPVATLHALVLLQIQSSGATLLIFHLWQNTFSS